MTLVKKVKQMVQSLGGAWQQSTGRDEMRRKWAGQTRTDIERVAARMGKCPGPAEISIRMGSNSRKLMSLSGIKLTQTAREGALLSEIGQSCRQCGE